MGALLLLVALSNLISARVNVGDAQVSEGARHVLELFGRNAHIIIYCVIFMTCFSVLALLKPQILALSLVKDCARVSMKVLSYAWGGKLFGLVGIALLISSFYLIKAALL